MKTFKKLGTAKITQQKGRPNSCNITLSKGTMDFSETRRVVFYHHYNRNTSILTMTIRDAGLDDNNNVFALQKKTGSFSFGCKEDPSILTNGFGLTAEYAFVDDGTEVFKLLSEEEYQEMLEDEE